MNVYVKDGTKKNTFSLFFYFLVSAQTVRTRHRHQPQQAGAVVILVQRVRGMSWECAPGGAKPRSDQEHCLQLYFGGSWRPGGGALQPWNASRLLRHPAPVLRAVTRLHPPARFPPEHSVGLQEPDASCKPVPRGGWRFYTLTTLWLLYWFWYSARLL